MEKWDEYFSKTKKKLGKRRKTFDKIFKYLDNLKQDKITILETGTYREENNYEGDGCSTLLFDKYVETHNGKLLSIDIDPKACSLARSTTGSNTEIICADSVEELRYLTGKVDLLYLDSCNLKLVQLPDGSIADDWLDDWMPAAHHLKELFAAKNIIKEGTLIVVDDNQKVPEDDIANKVVKGQRVGKGRLVYEVMDAIGFNTYFDSYQIGWIWKDEV